MPDHERITVLREPDREPPIPPAAGSRRRRLWELEGHAHCPVVGVCLPLAALRRLTNKVLGGEALADDYELHCGVIAECRQRTPLAETLQRELDRRYAVPLQRAGKLKTEAALAAWWYEASAGKDIAGAFWATLSHPRCTPTLEHRVLGDVHMLQHQLGTATRVDLARFEALIDENAVLTRELAAAQRRCTAQAAEHARRAEQAETGLVRLRAELITRDTALAQAREQLATLESSAPELRTRFELAQDNRRQAEQIHALQRALLQAEQEAERQRRRAAEATDDLALQRRSMPAAPAAPADTACSTPALSERAILCVGGRPASVPAYRQLIERTGGRFLHHDGGEQDSVLKLDATLAAADLVICQTGCISHDAYWRVKDHCKRTGKRCLFVETPSRAALERALGEAVQRSAPNVDAGLP
ncbi:DUF2325 domain-containing protein [Aquabacterium sp.]|uniref:DUF2325 domain-containing protein n=1 Tax=Aquabacterium sp. TaxID=1872578 RepID=UPI002C3AEF01|nr:DUF2325 domain-containing protein [Aquabacterium sp.]HSW04570.1 DUF2325 domain-containing protein [Aquabacterium sp.]